jgi:DNA-3-methyladenine glycosylase I
LGERAVLTSRATGRLMREVAAVKRCSWATGDPLMTAYHDREWGTPVHDDRRLFEFLILEGAQAGLSWQTILHKRTAYRRAFAGFRPERVARFGAADVRRLMRDAGIVRNRLKIAGAVRNARAFLAIAKEHGSFSAWVWRFVGGKPIVGRRRRNADNPSTTPESDELSKALKNAGFTFVGSTICYAFMQAVGMVDDHIATCFRAKRRAQQKE